MSSEKIRRPAETTDYYWEGEYIVFTRDYHLKRGYCCGSGCRHCPYEPQWTKGATAIATERENRQQT